MLMCVVWGAGCIDESPPPQTTETGADPAASNDNDGPESNLAKLNGLTSPTSSSDSATTVRPPAPPPPPPPPEPPVNPDPPLVPPGPQTEKPFVLEMSPAVKMEFAWIPPGEFMMGDGRNDLARHKESIEAFYLDAYEVTQAQWQIVMGKNPSLTRGTKYPVERVNWSDCVEFLRRMNAKYAASGMRFALPSEAQWEYACRAGQPLEANPTDSGTHIEDYAWMGRNSRNDLHPVGERKANEWGLYDMQGNVAEFCADIVKGERDDGEEWHVVRGGNIRSGLSECRSTSRFPRRGTVPLRQDGLRIICVPAK